jgi:hypothetical protein
MESEPSNINNNKRNDAVSQRRKSVLMVMRDVVLNNAPIERGGDEDIEANFKDPVAV